jgi:RNA polymerase sigma-70 factor (ECF subfamily)
MRTVSDGSLVRHARAGDPAAATELFERSWTMAWRIALAVTRDRSAADDIAQVALTRAFSRLSRFDVSRPFAPWLSRIVSRAAIDHLRTAPGWAAENADLPDVQLAPVDLGDVGDQLALAVLELEQDRRVVVVLRYWGDLGIDEIADMLGVPSGTVASRLSRALTDLRKRIEEGSHARPGL